MQFKSISKGTCSHSSSPPPIDDTCDGQTVNSACHHGQVNHYHDNTNTTEQRVLCGDQSLPEKMPLANVPLNLQEKVGKYNEEAPPPYEGNPPVLGIWTSEIAKVQPGKLRIDGQNKRRVFCGVFCQRTLGLLIIALGVYLCFSTVPTLLKNYCIAENLCAVQNEALRAINVVEDVNNIPPEYEGKLIHVTGLISVPEPLRFLECGITVQSVKVRRVFDTSRALSRSEFQPNDKWVDFGMDKENVCDREEYELDSVGDEEQISDVARIGSLVLGDRIKEKLDYNRFISSKFLIIGDERAFRVTYTDAGRNGEIYSVMGQLVNGTLQPYELFDYKIILANDFQVSAEIMILDRVNVHVEMLNAENWCAYIKIAMLVPLTVMFFCMRFMKAAKRYKRYRLTLDMVQ